MDNYAIYLRKSRADAELEKLGQGETLSRHRAALTELARKQDLNVVKIYEEIVSGDSIASRPQMQALLTDVEEGRYKGVLVMEIERLARGNGIDQGIVSQTFSVSKTLIITPYKTYNPESDIDEEYFEFGLFMARREYKTIKRRLKQGRVQCIKEGKYIGNAPYGYKKKYLQGQKGNTLEPFPEQAEVVKMIFDWYVHGIENPDGSFTRLGVQTITKRLNILGIPSAKQETWYKTSVREILLNPIYKGYVTWDRVNFEQKKKNDYIIVKGLHEPLVSEEVFDEAVRLMSKNPPLPAGHNKNIKNPLASLVVCAICGKTMIRHVASKFSFFMCPNVNCSNSRSMICYVEQRVLDTLKMWVADYDVRVDNNLRFSGSEIDREIEMLSSAKKAKEAELNALQKQLNTTYDLLEREVYSLEQFTERTKDIKARIEAELSDIQTIGSEIEKYKNRKAKRDVFIPKVKNVLEVYNELETAAEKNQLLKQIIQKIEYKKEPCFDPKTGKRKVDPDGFELTIYPLLPENTDF